MDVKIIKKLGEGCIGTVYKARFNNEDVIYKIEKITDISTYNRQIDFDNNIASKHPDKFLSLVSHGIIYNCKHMQTIPPVSGERKRDLIAKNKSKYCSYLMYKPILDGSFHDVRDAICNVKVLYKSFMYQIIDSINIMRINGYTQRYT